MPDTILPSQNPDFKNFALQSHGYSPDDYDLTDDGQVVPKVKAQPVAQQDATEPIAPEGAPVKPQTSIGGSLAHSAEANIAPTAAGLGAGATIASLLAAPETGGLSLAGLLLPLLGGGAAAYGTSKLQSKILPQAANEQLQAEQEQHPIASGIGGFLPSMVAFNPIKGAMELPDLARSGMKAFSRGLPSLTADESGHLLSTAANVGVSAGSDIAEQSQSDKPFDWGQLGLNVAGAGLLNTPTALGAKMLGGLHPEGSNISPPSEGGATEPISPRKQLTFPGQPSDTAIQLPDSTEPDRAGDFAKAKAEMQQQQLAEAQAIPSQPAAANTLRIELAKMLQPNIARPESQPDSLPRDNAGNQMKDNQTVESESPADLQARQMEQKLSGGEQDKYQEAQPEDNDPALLKNYPDSFKKAVYQIAARRGISLKEAIVVSSKTGNEARGAYQPATRTATINPRLATADTPIHEGEHGHIEDLLNSPIASDRALGKRGLDIFGGDTAQADEALASKLGQEGVPRIDDLLHGSAGKQFGNWFQDFVARWKNNLGMANDADVIRHLSARYVYDAPAGSRGEIPSTRYTGFQPGFGSMEGRRLYTAKEDIKDENGTVMVPKDSTVSENKLRELGVKFQEHSDLLKPTPIGYNDLSPEDKATYAKLHTDALTDRVNREKLGEGGSDKLIDSELALKKFEQEKMGMGGEKYQEAATKPEDVHLGSVMGDKSLSSKAKEEPLGYSTFSPTRPENDTILAKEGTKAEPFIAGLNKYYNLRDEYTGKYMTPVLDALKPLKSEQKDNLERVLIAERRAGVSYKDTLKSPEEKSAYDSIRGTLDKMQQDQIDAKQPVTRYRNDGSSFQTLPKKYEFFHPNQLDPNIIKELQDNPNGPKAAKIKDAFVQHYEGQGYTKEEGEAVFKGMTDAYDKGANDLSHFRGVSVEQGAGLPDALMRPGLERNMVRYIRRTANARAFHDAIEYDPTVARLIGRDKTPWNKPLEQSGVEPLHAPQVQDILGRIKGEDYNIEEGKIRSFNRVATSLFLGPLTNVHIAASSIANAITQFRPGELPGAIAHAITNLSKGTEKAIQTGYLQKNPTFLRDLFDAHSTQLERVNSLADGISRINGKSMTDKFTRSMLQAFGEYRARLSIPLANSGDMVAIRLMRNLDPSWVKNKPYTPAQVDQLASNFGTLLHGAHDSRTLPSIMLGDSIAQPFLSLASWSVAQTNNFMRHTWTPAIREGNFTPLIMSTLGAALGGYAIKELREKISNKTSPIPSLEEIAKSKGGLSGNVPLLAYNFMAMASFAGYAGILSTVGKNIFDTVYKNPRQGAAFPLDEVLGGSLTTMSNAMSAIANSQSPEDYVKIGSKALADLFKENVQLARVGLSWADESGALGKQRQVMKNLNTQEQDLRRFKMVNGMPYNDEGSIDQANPYFNMQRKSFQREQDLPTAAKELPDLIHQAISSSNGNIEVMKNKLKALKTESYPSMPNPENTPMTFWRYVKFLGDTQGPDVAAKRVAEYYHINAINRAKSSMVPSL